jgi:predicted phosphodiesterase
MRLAIFSDVHGNWTALQEVWAAIEAESGFDAVVCAGDLASGRPRGEECLRFLKEKGVECIMGNHDSELVGWTEPTAEQMARMPWAAALHEWTKAHVSEDSKAFVRGLPVVRSYPGVGGSGALVVCHASPHDLNPICLPKATDEEWATAIGPIAGSAVAFGHVHMPQQRTIGGKLFVNVSHCGLGFAHNVGYAVLSSDASGWNAERRRVPHDPVPEREYALSVGMPMKEDDVSF